jgi:alkylation response protein AidB-like acyl-CoA dehydrogenase
MFTMMNYERLGVGIQGLATGERSYQNAVEYARDRLQSRSPSGAQARTPWPTRSSSTRTCGACC